MEKLKIMVINDSEEVLALFQDILQNEEGHEVVLCSYRIRDLDEIRAQGPDLLILDQVYGNESAGWKLMQKVRMTRDLAQLPMVFCTTDLRRAQAEDVLAQAPQPGGPHLQADDEQEHHHAQLGDVQDGLRLTDQAYAPRPHREAGGPQAVREPGGDLGQVRHGARSVTRPGPVMRASRS